VARTPKRLAGPAAVSNAAATKYTVPATTKTIVRHVHVENGTASAATFTMSVGTDAAGTRTHDGVSVAANATLDWYCYLVLEATETIQALSGTNNALTLTIDGDEITLG
jgi:hypothetical protein